jgi:hypothetical protein
MKIKTFFLLLFALAVVTLLYNSCKKEYDSANIKPLFTVGSWQLGSVIIYNYVGSNLLTPDTLNENCIQHFTFKSDGTCSYTNFHCITQTSNGTWSLSNDGLVMFSNISVDTLQDTKLVPAHPFIYCKIINVGQYSMVLQTGDVGAYFTPTSRRRIVQYGFVHISTTN